MKGLWREWRRVAVAAATPIVALAFAYGAWSGKAAAGPNIWTPAGPRLVAAVVARDDVGNVYAVDTVAARRYGIEGLSTTVYRSTDGGATWTGAGDYTTARGAHYGEPLSLSASSDGTMLLMAIKSDRGDPSEQPVSLLKSTDKGATWQIQAPRLEFAPRYGQPAKVVFDPQNPQRLYTSGSGGFFRSTDGGATWQIMPTSVDSPGDSRYSSGAGAIAVDPANPARVLALTFNSLKVSEDYGTTWRTVRGNNAPRAEPGGSRQTALVFLPRESGPSHVVIVTMRSRATAIVLSKDAGETWSTVLTVAGTGESSRLGTDVAGGRIYVLLRTSGPPHLTLPGQPPAPSPSPPSNPPEITPIMDVDTLFTSTDGDRWEAVGRAQMDRRITEYGLAHTEALFVSEKDPQRIFRSDAAFSSDGGRTWASVTDQLPSYSGRSENFVLGSDAWLAAESETLYRSTDRGKSWSLLASGNDFFFNRISGMGQTPGGNTVLAYYFPERVTGGPGGHFERVPALMRSTDGGGSWSLTGRVWGENARFTFADGNGQTVYAALSPYYFYGSGSQTSREQNGALLKSTDGGATWITSTVGMVVNNVLADPTDPSHLWAAGDDGLAESRNAGASWSPVRTNPQLGGLIYNELGSSTTLYTYEARGYNTGGVTIPGSPGGVQRGPLYKSTDGGRSWFKLVLTGAPADYRTRTFAVGRPGQVVVAWAHRGQAPHSPVQVSESLDGGRTWRTLNGLGLGEFYGNHLQIDPQTGIIYAGGCCSGIAEYRSVEGAADPAFAALWQRQDLPVQRGQVQRSWTWGPQPFSTLREQLAGITSGARVVQYWDKSRMEVNNPGGDRNSPWFVTNGLLTVEMVAGRVQVGLTEWEPRRAARLPVAGDPQPNNPTYLSFRGVASYENGNNKDPDRTGQSADKVIDAAGIVRTGGPVTNTVRLAMYDREGGHNIAAPFWEYLNRRGPVLENGRLVERSVLGDWVFVMGRPISDPYWVRVDIRDRGQMWVLVQLFERRTLTYTPANPPEWQVEMGNVGLHYYLWRYGDSR